MSVTEAKLGRGMAGELPSIENTGSRGSAGGQAEWALEAGGAPPVTLEAHLKQPWGRSSAAGTSGPTAGSPRATVYFWGQRLTREDKASARAKGREWRQAPFCSCHSSIWEPIGSF